MNRSIDTVLDVARKELRAAFESPVALLFTGAFLVTCLLSFFTLDGFFARNIADLRPLFNRLPLLLLLLVGAITMRAWAEERARGTLEVLLTLPVRTWELVLGKFLGGLALVALALAMTAPLPLTVAALGELDWGPVIGGYLGALLLAGAYLAAGLFVSARTDNPVVALMITLAAGGLLVLVGDPAFTGFFGETVAGTLRGIGSGSRFESVARGVLDLRDLAYYGSVTAFFLALNVHALEAPRRDPGSPGGRSRGRSAALLAALVGLNALALNLWLAPVHALRVDLTERGEHSLSQATKHTLARLDEPLYLDGYFSERTHPLLAPLVPRVKDLLKEYEAASGGRVVVRFADPSADEALEQEIGQAYGLRSVPLAVSERSAQSVINAWFHVLVRYGDQHRVLGFDDLIDVRATATDGLSVELRNLEYDLTRAIRRASQDFQSVEALIAGLPEGAKMTLYATPETTPEAFAEAVDALRSVAGELADQGLAFEEVAPELSEAAVVELADRLGVQPLAADLFGQRLFYAHLVIEAGDKVERVLAGGAEADARRDVEAAIRRLSPGQLKTVGLLTEAPQAPAPDPGLPPQLQRPPPRADYQLLERQLSEEYQVERLDLSDGEVPDHVDVLIVGKAGALDDAERFALDQYLMRGGAVVALAGRWRADASGGGLSAVEEDGALFELLETWGVSVGEELVADPQNAAFPIPVQRRQGPFVVNAVEMLPYPFFPDIRRGGYSADHPVFASLPNVTAPWASPLTVGALPEGVDAETLMSTSDGSWLVADGEIQPDFARWPEAGFGAGEVAGAQAVAVTLTGAMPSYFAERPDPTWDEQPGEGEGEVDRTGRTLKAALPGARLTVIGSSELSSDLMMQVADQMAGEVHRANLGLVANLVDWSTEDGDLLSIRSPGAFARTLLPLSEQARRRWEWANYGAALSALAALAWASRRRRRLLRPIPLMTEQPGGAK